MRRMVSDYLVVRRFGRLWSSFRRFAHARAFVTGSDWRDRAGQHRRRWHHRRLHPVQQGSGESRLHLERGRDAGLPPSRVRPPHHAGARCRSGQTGVRFQSPSGHRRRRFGERRLRPVVDRQRLEVKTFGPSPDYVKGFFGDTVSYRWRFKLDADFQPSTAFTHIHQIKAGDGTNTDDPIFTLTPVTLSTGGERLEVRYITSAGGSSTRLQGSISHRSKANGSRLARRSTYSETGTYFIEIRRVSDGAVLLTIHQPTSTPGVPAAPPSFGRSGDLSKPDRPRDAARRAGPIRRILPGQGNR